ncbi:IS5 family transposase [Fimbriiglobus ruber]|uniref:Mobile element protein n=1 Tax=Fimbriiglobus ruber TaxID=1908690 RepID=A0A225DCA8_9BACT|nr:IS5 family transposase [Fimbriiglobus ruber]OWK39122.1 Mobile element protein [Fimbriiglobus ruber]
MPEQHAISDENWERIQDLLPGRPDQPGWTSPDNRLFMDAILWVAKTGAPWRDLPARFGKWNSVWRRFDRWCRKGTWPAVFETLQDPDLEWLIMDSTIIRAHPSAAGAKKNPDGSGGQDEQAFGRSRGGFGTKIHGAVNGLGLPVRWILTPGQDADVTQAKKLIDGIPFAFGIGDQGYDSQTVVNDIRNQGGTAVIPSRKNSKTPRVIDGHLYKERNLVERFWSKVKQYRRVATRYEKTARNFLGFIHVSSIMIMLK